LIKDHYVSYKKKNFFIVIENQVEVQKSTYKKKEGIINRDIVIRSDLRVVRVLYILKASGSMLWVVHC